ncbi:MAG: twin-arginine translocase TatA/TatE family subunit [Candidatus Hydrothermarchaeales archaeon]
MISLMVLGQPELLIILFIILILFGSSKLPELARSMGRAKSEFKKGMEEDTEEEKKKLEAQKVEAAPEAPAPAPEAPTTPPEEPPATPKEE